MLRFFDAATAEARGAAGVADRRIVLDPGIGFGNDEGANLALILGSAPSPRSATRSWSAPRASASSAP